MRWPKVSVLLAIYEPRLDWLAEQLDSLRRQDYVGELELLVYNDAPWSTDFLPLLEKHLVGVSYRLYTAERNGGSNAAFARLTELSSGEVLAYCDQDDVWLPDKLTRLVECLICNDVSLCFGDAEVMDGEGRQIAVSLQAYRPRQWVPESAAMARELLLRNFVPGAALVIHADTARQALPFPAVFVHDHWLALVAARERGIAFCTVPVLRYRVHGANQTGVLAGISSREDYVRQRIERDWTRLLCIKQRLGNLPGLPEVEHWLQCRRQYARKASVSTLAALCHCLFGFRWQVTLFELLLPFFPGFLLHRLLARLKG